MSSLTQRSTNDKDLTKRLAPVQPLVDSIPKTLVLGDITYDIVCRTKSGLILATNDDSYGVFILRPVDSEKKHNIDHPNILTYPRTLLDTNGKKYLVSNAIKDSKGDIDYNVVPFEGSKTDEKLLAKIAEVTAYLEITGSIKPIKFDDILIRSDGEILVAYFEFQTMPSSKVVVNLNAAPEFSDNRIELGSSKGKAVKIVDMVITDQPEETDKVQALSETEPITKVKPTEPIDTVVTLPKATEDLLDSDLLESLDGPAREAISKPHEFCILPAAKQLELFEEANYTSAEKRGIIKAILESGVLPCKELITSYASTLSEPEELDFVSTLRSISSAMIKSRILEIVEKLQVPEKYIALFAAEAKPEVVEGIIAGRIKPLKQFLEIIIDQDQLVSLVTARISGMTLDLRLRIVEKIVNGHAKDALLGYNQLGEGRPEVEEALAQKVKIPEEAKDCILNSSRSYSPIAQLILASRVSYKSARAVIDSGKITDPGALERLTEKITAAAELFNSQKN